MRKGHLGEDLVVHHAVDQKSVKNLGRINTCTSSVLEYLDVQAGE